ncbi:MAG TPA: hypothetical protein VN783_00405 [Thermoanaerobaculia bacterium]|nr:hypothetical protein [Thermoanaerobaculia bacterium]
MTPGKRAPKRKTAPAVDVADASDKVTALDVPPGPQRLGFPAGETVVPEDFDRMGEAEIAALFGIGE